MNHRGTKVLETERLQLRPFRAEGAEPMFRNWASDPEVTKFLTWPPHENVKVTGQVLDEWIKHYEDPKNYNWAIQWKKTNEPIGSLTAVRIDDQTESATVGYCIGQNWWRQGVTSEALQAVMDFFFQEVGVNCVNACHDPRNPNSGRVMKKCGMSLEGIRRVGGVNNQGICDETWYSILKEEYEKKKGRSGGSGNADENQGPGSAGGESVGGFTGYVGGGSTVESILPESAGGWKPYRVSGAEWGNADWDRRDQLLYGDAYISQSIRKKGVCDEHVHRAWQQTKRDRCKNPGSARPRRKREGDTQHIP